MDNYQGKALLRCALLRICSYHIFLEWLAAATLGGVACQKMQMARFDDDDSPKIRTPARFEWSSQHVLFLAATEKQ